MRWEIGGSGDKCNEKRHAADQGEGSLAAEDWLR
jgi:hypothetical protein